MKTSTQIISRILSAWSGLQNQLLFATCGVFIAGSITGCSTMSALPDEDNVKVSREEADEDCEFLGKLEGRSMSKLPKQEEALKDLRKEAANKGANYLVVKEYSGMGTAVTGLAYKCP